MKAAGSNSLFTLYINHNPIEKSIITNKIRPINAANTSVPPLLIIILRCNIELMKNTSAMQTTIIIFKLALEAMYMKYNIIFNGIDPIIVLSGETYML